MLTVFITTIRGFVDNVSKHVLMCDFYPVRPCDKFRPFVKIYSRLSLTDFRRSNFAISNLSQIVESREDEENNRAFLHTEIIRGQCSMMKIRSLMRSNDISRKYRTLITYPNARS